MQILLLLFWVLSDSASASDLKIHIKECGRYQFNGVVDCKELECDIVLFKKSQSELRVPVRQRKFLYKALNGKSVEGDFIVESLDPLRVVDESAPQTALPAGSSLPDTIKLLEKRGCK